MDRLMALDLELMGQAIRRSCEIKAGIVSRDEKEQNIRALLNFGHTFGNAIETGLGYGAWLHGEAVGAGMVMASKLSVRLGMCSAADSARLAALVARVGLPTAAPATLTDQFLALMSRDKKVTDQGLRLVLLNGLGRATLVDGVDEKDLAAVING